jgi:alkylation response protein AidB-like acyl-CoA dehydrogenase
MAGGAARLLEDTLEYVKIRMQFGRAIASFQAIKHRCAEMLLQVELAKSAAYYAAEASDALDIDSAEATYLASLAKAGASEAYLHTAIEAIQLHGGLGFTFDQDTHLWFKRAKSSEVMFGDPAWHRERMMGELIVKERALRAQQAPQTGQPA